MRSSGRRARVSGLVVFAVAAAGCGGGSTPTQPSAVSTTTTTMPAPARATIAGRAVAEMGGGDAVPLAGVTVEVVGVSPPITATSGPDGTFSLQAPIGVAVLRLTAAGYWGALAGLEVSAAGVSDFELPLSSDLEVADTGAALGRVLSESNGIVAVLFANESGSGGEAASLSAPSDPPFVIVPGVGYADGNALRAGSPPLVTFTNVPPGTTQVEASGVAGRNSCTVEPAGLTAWPVEARTITYPLALCTG